MERQPDLLQVVPTGVLTGSLSCLLNSWQQDRDQNGDDRDHHKELNEGKPSTDGSTHDSDSPIQN